MPNDFSEWRMALLEVEEIGLQVAPALQQKPRSVAAL
jgi:hypothetical protein